MKAGGPQADIIWGPLTDNIFKNNNLGRNEKFLHDDLWIHYNNSKKNHTIFFKNGVLERDK